MRSLSLRSVNVAGGSDKYNPFFLTRILYRKRTIQQEITEGSMTIEECSGLHLPCLVQHKPTGLIIRITHISGGEGVGSVKYVRDSDSYTIGEHSNHWHMNSFDMMDNNDLYEDQQ